MAQDEATATEDILRLGDVEGRACTSIAEEIVIEPDIIGMAIRHRERAGIHDEAFEELWEVALDIPDARELDVELASGRAVILS